MTAKPPAFQFYAKDFLVGTMEMSLLEIGAYAKLLAWSWDNGPVPSDDRKRAIILGVTERSLRAIWDGIADKWESTPAGYVNRRLERQRELLAEFAARQSERGKAGATGRWHKQASSNGVSMRPPVTQAQPDDGSAVCNLQSPEDQEQEQTPTRVRAYPTDFENFWRAYPNRTGKGAALKVWQRLRPDPGLLARMFEALEWQVNQPSWRRDGGKYIPHPATWLNGRRWEDEPFHALDSSDDAFDRVVAGKGQLQ